MERPKCTDFGASEIYIGSEAQKRITSNNIVQIDRYLKIKDAFNCVPTHKGLFCREGFVGVEKLSY